MWWEEMKTPLLGFCFATDDDAWDWCWWRWRRWCWTLDEFPHKICHSMWAMQTQTVSLGRIKTVTVRKKIFNELVRAREWSFHIVLCALLPYSIFVFVRSICNVRSTFPSCSRRANIVSERNTRPYQRASSQLGRGRPHKVFELFIFFSSVPHCWLGATAVLFYPCAFDGIVVSTSGVVEVLNTKSPISLFTMSFSFCFSSTCTSCAVNTFRLMSSCGLYLGAIIPIIAF